MYMWCTNKETTNKHIKTLFLNIERKKITLASETHRACFCCLSIVSCSFLYHESPVDKDIVAKNKKIIHEYAKYIQDVK